MITPPETAANPPLQPVASHQKLSTSIARAARTRPWRRSAIAQACRFDDDHDGEAMKKIAYAVQDQETIGKRIEGRRSGHALEICCGVLQRDPRRQNLVAQTARVAPCGRIGGDTLDAGGDRLQRRTQSGLHLPRIVIFELP